MDAKIINRILITSLFVFSFNSHATEPSSPIITTSSEVGNCRFISAISASSGFGKQANWRQLCQHKMLQEAKDAGATHVVIENITTIGAYNGTIDASVYICRD
ncbi:MAG: hypothetical protein PHF31_00825 [Methylobacter sp.]|nr:hypothetical protein [Methylobacter sp.]